MTGAPGESPVKVAIVVVSYNALGYARRMLRSVRRTRGVPYEMLVVDNDSGLPTKLFWIAQRLLGRINRLALLDRNTFFAEGNNIGVAMAPPETTHLLLLNTDCEVVDPDWLRRMLAVHREGATGLRYVTGGPWPRADGFCLLVDRACWGDGLDETYQWWWSITGLEARLLREGRSVQAVEEYKDVVFHHGHGSGDAFKGARSGDTDPDMIRGWFEGREVTVVERLPDVG
jgi:glycosyltransferase involved in cell wall biosynthesis